MLKRLLILCLTVGGLSVNAALFAQDMPQVRVRASDWAIGGTMVAVALAHEVLIYDMNALEDEPLRFPFSGTQALAFTQDSFRYNDGEPVDVFRLALANHEVITIIQPRTLEILRVIDQPATALLWSNRDLELLAGYRDSVYVYDASWLHLIYGDGDEMYALENSITMPDSVESADSVRKDIVSLHQLENTLFIRWRYTLNYVNHGGEYYIVSQWPLTNEEAPTAAPDAMWDVLRQLEAVQFSENTQRLLVGRTWVDIESGQVIELPLE